MIERYVLNDIIQLQDWKQSPKIFDRSSTILDKFLLAFICVSNIQITSMFHFQLNAHFYLIMFFISFDQLGQKFSVQII